MTQLVQEVGEYSNISASALLHTGQGRLLGIFCASSTGGTAKVWDSLSAAGAVVVNTFPLTPGAYYPIPAKFYTGCYITIGGTADVTAFFDNV